MTTRPKPQRTRSKAKAKTADGDGNRLEGMVVGVSIDHMIGRVARRQKSFQPGYWIGGGGKIALHFLDISESGARAHSAVPPIRGACVQVFCGLPLGRAIVRWVSAKSFGLEFVVPLTPEAVTKVLGLDPRKDTRYH